LETNFHTFTDAFTAEWVRANPELATSSQYFAGHDENQIDRELTPYSITWPTKRAELASRGVRELARFEQSELSIDDRISMTAMRWHLEAAVCEAKFDDQAYVFNQHRGLPSSLFSFLTQVHPVRHTDDVENYLIRLSQVAARLDEAVILSEDRDRRGILAPRFILTQTIKQTEQLAAPEAEYNLLVSSLADRMEGAPAMPGGAKSRYLATAVQIVKCSVLPALARVISSLAAQLCRATDEAGLSKLPDGYLAYTNRLRQNTTMDMTPDEIHRVGLEEIGRIEDELDAALDGLGYSGATIEERYWRAFADHEYTDPGNSREEILRSYRKIIEDAERRSRNLFEHTYPAAVQLAQVPSYRAQQNSASYRPAAPDGSRAGSFCIPIVGHRISRIGMKALAFHETIPGHHFQFECQRKNRQLPRFRRDRLFGRSPAFTEGWALYAEGLALENGWYEDDRLGEVGALWSMLRRARRLVVDTGLHTRRWTREAAIAFGLNERDVDRCIVSPGQACAYTIGLLQILKERERTRRELRSHFRLREFNDLVLRTGTVPMKALNEAVTSFVGLRIVSRLPADHTQPVKHDLAGGTQLLENETKRMPSTGNVRAHSRMRS
jgi:uncharacterized protein (DUF885 family)